MHFSTARHPVQLHNYNRRLEEVKGCRLSFLPKLLQNGFGKLITKAEMWLKAENYNLEKIKSSQYVTRASVELRTKMFIFVEVAEVVYCVIVWFISKKICIKVSNF